MNKSFAMIIAGFITTLVVIGGTVAAAQSGVLMPATTTIQTNGDINVPMAAQQYAPPTIEAMPTLEPALTEQVQVITRTEIIPPQLVTQTVVITQENPGREAELTQRLNEAYQVMKQREAAYQAKLKEAYDKLKVQAQVQVQAQAQASAPQSQPAQSQPPAGSSAPNDDHKETPPPQSTPEKHKDDSHDKNDK